MRKKILAVIAAALLFAGCSAEIPQEEKQGFMDAYTELGETDVFYEGTHESVEKMLAHGTGIICFSFPECPWCQKYVPLLNEAAQDTGVSILYYDIYTDKENDREWYDSIAAEIEEKDSSISRYDNDGNLLIYMPLVLFVKEGEIIGYDDETCDLSSDEVSPDTYWTQERRDAFFARMKPLMEEIRASQDEKNSGGCAIRETPGC